MPPPMAEMAGRRAQPACKMNWAQFGVMVALTPSGIAPVELVDAVDSIRTVPPDGEIVRVGRALGISFGGG